MNANTKFITISAFALLAFACTSYDASLSPQEQENLDASNAYQSQSGDLDFNPDGSYLLKGQKLAVDNTVNGQPVFKNITVDGVEYTIVAAKYDYGMAVYALNDSDQFADIGSNLDNISANDLTASLFAGKYFERTIDENGNISKEHSAAITLTLDMNSGTLTSSLGPSIEYQWDANSQSFTGINTTTGEIVAYESDILLGHYQTPNGSSTDYGTFWAIGE